jgi:hypothetical protein
MFEVTTCRVLVLDQLRPGSAYVLATGLEGPQSQRYPAGLRFRYSFAVVNLYSGDAEVHGLDGAGGELIFRTRAYEHRTLFVGEPGQA